MADGRRLTQLTELQRNSLPAPVPSNGTSAVRKVFAELGITSRGTFTTPYPREASTGQDLIWPARGGRRRRESPPWLRPSQQPGRVLDAVRAWDRADADADLDLSQDGVSRAANHTSHASASLLSALRTPHRSGRPAACGTPWSSLADPRSARTRPRRPHRNPLKKPELVLGPMMEWWMARRGSGAPGCWHSGRLTQECEYLCVEALPSTSFLLAGVGTPTARRRRALPNDFDLDELSGA